MFSFKLLSKLGALLLWLILPLLASSVVVAAPFTVTYTNTIGATSSSPPFNIGEAFTYAIILDNGGTTTATQTWTSADVVSVSLSLNNGAITTVFDTTSLDFNTGNFVTDAAGLLTAAPSQWLDLVPSGVISTNDPNPTNLQYNISTSSDIYSNGLGVARSTNGAAIIIAANWTNPASAMAPATPVPTLSQWAMIMLSLMLLAIGMLKTRRSY